MRVQLRFHKGLSRFRLQLLGILKSRSQFRLQLLGILKSRSWFRLQLLGILKSRGLRLQPEVPQVLVLGLSLS